MIDEKRLGQALKYMAETDETAAQLLANQERMEFRAKAKKDALITHGEGGVGERTAAAGCHEEYLADMDLYFRAVEEFRKVHNKRQTESLVVDVWRSLNSARSKGIL